MKKVALYGRVSSDEQKERKTIENQTEILESYVDFREFETYKMYLDDGISGAVPLYERPSGRDLVEDAKNKLFDIILVWKVDRFGRDTLTGLQAVEVLREYGIEIISVTEPFDLNTPIGRYQFINYLNMAELERSNILDRMYLGATRAAKKGKWMGGVVPYGYIVNRDGYLEINEEEAKVIRTIFNLYVEEKLPTLEVAVYLNNLNITSTSTCMNNRGKRTKGITGKWISSTIQRIINSTTYKGVHYYGKRGTRRKELIRREVPAIVTEEIWEKAQTIKKQNVIMSKRNLKNREFLLRKLIKCKHCGKTFYGITYAKKSDVYVCSGKRGDNKKVFGIKCTSANVNADMIEEYIWGDCLNILKNYDHHISTLKKNSNTIDKDIIGDLEKLKKTLLNTKSEKNKILSLFRKDIITEEELTEQLEDIKKEEKRVLSLISIMENKLDSYKHEDELISNMSEKLKTYYKRIDELGNDDKYEIIRLLVKSIEVETIIKDGSKIPKIHVVYNLVKLDNCTDRC
ncbi:MAG: recombinase family protein [Clostridiaceae bacterium]